MANTKSAIKRIRRISKQTTVNKARRSRYKNAIKKMNLFQNLSNKEILAASDAFFPFADGMQALINAGVKVIIQPGGSINDKEIIKAANDANIVMAFTGTRHFKH